MERMIAAFPFHSADVAKLHNLLAFISELGGCKQHIALLVADAATPYADCVKARNLALQSFSDVKCIANGATVQGWPQGPNSLFFAAAHYIEGILREPWLFCETDCVPLKSGWLDSLAAEYKGLDTFMGDLYGGLSSDKGLPMRALSGIAVYPPNAASLLKDDPAMPWDMANRELMLLKGVATPLIKHYYGTKALPPTFAESKSPDSAKNVLTPDDIRSQAVLFHRNKDGTLIEILRKRMRVSSNPPNVLYAKVQTQAAPTASPPAPAKGTIVIRRTMAIGDCIAATFLADQLWAQGYDVEFQASSYCHAPLSACLSISEVTLPKTEPHINLDGAYEWNPNRNSQHFAQAYHIRAAQNLAKIGHQLPPCANFAPRLNVTPLTSTNEFFAKHPRPWIVIAPRSNGTVSRTVPDMLWAIIATKLKGTCFWLGNHHAAPAPIVDLQCKTVAKVMDYIANADFFIGCDSGPMHIAAALGKPGLVVHQSSNPELHLSDQRDFSMFNAPVDCLDCNGVTCKFGGVPKCQHIGPDAFAAEATKRLGLFDMNKVAAVVAVYKPAADKLTRCLNALSPQVDHIILVGDQATVMPNIPLPNNVRYVCSWQRDIGYGRKANYGMRYTGAGWVMLVNDDVYLEPDVVTKLMTLASKVPKAGVVGHMLRFPDGTIQHGGTGRTPDNSGWMHLDHRRAKSRFESPVELENVTGASVLVRREAFYQAMGFDERFYLYCEDNDLCMKVRQNGWRVLYHPNATGTHEESQSTRQTPNMHKHMMESVGYFHSKWDHLLKQPAVLPQLI